MLLGAGLRLIGRYGLRNGLRSWGCINRWEKIGVRRLNTGVAGGFNGKNTETDYMKCTILDENGDIAVYGKDIKRLQLLKSNNLVPRDFRKISRHYHGIGGSIKPDIVPSLLTRSDCILVNILNIRALIKHDKVILFDNFTSNNRGSRLNESHTQSIFVKKLRSHLKMKGDETLPYEFRALESILIHVMENLTTEMNVHKTVLKNILFGLDESIDLIKLRYLLIQSKKITQFHQKASLIRDLLEDLLEQDDELNDLYLTERFQGRTRNGNDHAEIEILLESYLKTNDEIVQTVENLKSQIKTNEEIINVILDSNRNELMLLGLKFTTGLVSMGVALYVAALYGMNLEVFIEETDGGFESVVLIGTVLMAIIFFFTLKKLKKVGKMTMTGMNREIRVNSNKSLKDF